MPRPLLAYLAWDDSPCCWVLQKAAACGNSSLLDDIAQAHGYKMLRATVLYMLAQEDAAQDAAAAAASAASITASPVVGKEPEPNGTEAASPPSEPVEALSSGGGETATGQSQQVVSPAPASLRALGNAKKARPARYRAQMSAQTDDNLVGSPRGMIP